LSTENGGFLRTKALVSLKSGKVALRLLLSTSRMSVLYALAIGAKINDLGWPWRVIMHSVSKRVRHGVDSICSGC